MNSDFFAEQLARVFIEQANDSHKKTVTFLFKKTLVFPKFTVKPLLIHIKPQLILN